MAEKNEPKLSDVMKRIRACFVNEDRKDALFRQALVTNEVGDWAKFLTHDPGLNPGARPAGGKPEEIMAAGQAFCMLVSLALARDIDVAEAIEVGLKNWEDADWRKREATKGLSQNEVRGIAASGGTRTGKAYVVSTDNPIEKLSSGMILVTSFASPDLAIYFDRAIAVVTDHGGQTSHAANIAREKNLSCVVGTGDATQKIKHGDTITVDSDVKTEIGIVTINKQ